MSIDKKKAIKFIHKIKDEYQKQIISVADLINNIAKYIPARRNRKLHVGLFGYSRSLKGISLPRAIKFCAAFYSIGVPSELLGLNALSEKEFEELQSMYVKFDEDLKDIFKWINIASVKKMPSVISKGLLKVLDMLNYNATDFENEEYVEITNCIYNALSKGDQSTLVEDIKRAAWMRRFLG